MDNLRIGKICQKLELISFLCLVGVVNAEILYVFLLELWGQAVHDVGSVAGITHVTVGVYVAKVNGSLIHHRHIFLGDDFSAGQTTEFCGKGWCFPQGKIGWTHDSAVFEIHQYPGATAGNKVLVIHVKNLVAAGKLEPCGGFFPSLYPEGLVCLGMAEDSQADSRNKDGKIIILQHLIAHAPLVIVLHGTIGGG